MMTTKFKTVEEIRENFLSHNKCDHPSEYQNRSTIPNSHVILIKCQICDKELGRSVEAPKFPQGSRSALILDIIKDDPKTVKEIVKAFTMRGVYERKDSRHKDQTLSKVKESTIRARLGELLSRIEYMKKKNINGIIYWTVSKDPTIFDRVEA